MLLCNLFVNFLAEKQRRRQADIIYNYLTYKTETFSLFYTYIYMNEFLSV